MILVYLQGRLGNHLFQVFTAIAVALDTRQSFGFYKTNKENDCAMYWDTVFQSIKYHVYPFSFRKKRQHLYREPYFHYTPITDILAPYRGNICLVEGYFQSPKYFEHHLDVILNMLRLDDLQRQVCTRVWRDMSFVQDWSHTISLHFRIGDYVKYADRHPVMPLQYYKNALKFISQNDKSQQARQVIYFCEIADIDRVLAMVVELSREFPWLEFYKVPDGLEDWEELFTMSCCQHHIIANSTFSWWGAYLNKKPHKLVCYPSLWFGPWFQPPPDMRDRVPSTWYQIDVNK
jgi:hypothetical protein